VQRRVFLTYLAGLTGAALLDLDPLTEAHPAGAELLSVRQAVTDLAHANLGRTPAAAYRVLVRHAARLAADIRTVNITTSTSTPPLRDGLIGIRAETLGHAGAVAGLTLGRPGVAARHLDDALGDAEQVGAFPLRAWLLARRAKLATYAGALDDAVLTLLGARQAPGLDAATGAWIDAQLGEAYGLQGSDRACMAALERAGEGVERAASGPAVPWIGGFDQTRLAGYTGICELRLGRPAAAEVALLDGLAAGRHPAVLVDLADTYRVMGEPEQAARVGADALGLVAASPSRLFRDRFRGMLGRLMLRYPAVAGVVELEERSRVAGLAA